MNAYIKLPDDMPDPDVKEGEYSGPAGEGASENLWDYYSMRDYARQAVALNRSESPAEPLDREAIRNALLGEVIEWLETEVSAIDTWYRGNPSYEHDAGYMKDRVLHLLTEAKTAFGIDQPAQPSDSQAEPSDTALLQNALTAILWLERRLQPGYRKD